MYRWVWRRLPGTVTAKVAISLFAAVVAVAVLFLVVFPAVSAHLPFSHVTVTN